MAGDAPRPRLPDLASAPDLHRAHAAVVQARGPARLNARERPGTAGDEPAARRLEPAVREDAAELAALRNAVAMDMTRRFGRGHWSHPSTVTGQLVQIERGGVWVMRGPGGLVAALRLLARRTTNLQKPYFTPVRRAMFLTSMAVHPSQQGRGFGRACLAEAERIAREQRAGAIRLDAYDHVAGAGAFYARCGYRERGRRTYFRAPIIYYERLM